MKRTNEIKMGVFLITGLALLIFGWAYLREFAIHKQLAFTVVFNDVIGLTKGSFIRINGLRVGRVDSLTLDTKENQVFVNSRIQIPKVEIPVDSKIYIRTSGYVGDKYLDIELGMSSKFIQGGETIAGEPALDAFESLEKISQVLNQLQPEIIGQSIQDFTSGAAKLVKKADSVVENTDKIVKTLPNGQELAKLIDKAHDTVNQLNQAVDKAQTLATDASAQSNIMILLTQANSISSDLNQTLKNANSIANNKEAFENVNTLLVRATKIIEQLDELKADPLVQNELRETLNNANVAAKKIAFTSDEVSTALNQRFLLPRLLFGKLTSGRKKVDKIEKAKK